MSEQDAKLVREPSAAVSRAQKRLLFGALIGLTAALTTVVAPGRGARVTLPDDVAALVDGKPVQRSLVARAAGLVASDRKPNASDVPTDEIVRRLVEEELLVQRAVAVGILDSDVSVRRAIVRAMLDSIVLDAESAAVDAAALKEFFESYRDRFMSAPRLEVERVVFHEKPGGVAAAKRAALAVGALRSGAPTAEVRASYGDEPLVVLPSGPLSPAELTEYAGPEAARLMTQAQPGDVTSPLATDNGLQVLRLRRRLTAPSVSFENERPLIESVYRKQRVDEALRAYLERLWNSADIVLAKDLAN